MSKWRTVTSALQAAIALSKNMLFVIVQQISTVFLDDIILQLTTVLKKYFVLQVGTVFQWGTVLYSAAVLNTTIGNNG